MRANVKVQEKNAPSITYFITCDSISATMSKSIVISDVTAPLILNTMSSYRISRILTPTRSSALSGKIVLVDTLDLMQWYSNHAWNPQPPADGVASCRLLLQTACVCRLHVCATADAASTGYYCRLLLQMHYRVHLCRFMLGVVAKPDDGNGDRSGNWNASVCISCLITNMDLLWAPAQALHTVCVQVERRQLAHATDEPHTELFANCSWIWGLL